MWPLIRPRRVFSRRDPQSGHFVTLRGKDFVMGDCLADHGYLYRVPTNNVGILKISPARLKALAGNFGIWPIISQNPLLLNRVEWTPVDFL